MKERWVVEANGRGIDSVGGWHIAVTCRHFPDDWDGSKTAQAICDEHNAALDRRRAPVTIKQPEEPLPKGWKRLDHNPYAIPRMTPDDLAKAIEAAAQNIGKTTGDLRGKWEMHLDVLIGMQQWWAKEASGL